jgi:hypothetical protein
MEENIVSPGGLPAASPEADPASQPQAVTVDPAPATATSPAQPVQYAVINNETDSFIQIKSVTPGIPALIIAPFGSRTLSRDWLVDYDFLDWEEQKLITIDFPDSASETTGDLVVGLLVIGLVLFWIVSIAANLIWGSIGWTTIGWVSLGFFVLTGVTMVFNDRAQKARAAGIKTRRNISGWLKLIPGMALVLLTGIGLPLSAVYFFGDGKALLDSARDLPALGRLMQVTFISLASMLPALFFYLFGRQQIEIQKDNFYQEVMSLDPNVHSLTETRTKYEALIDSVYGSGTAPLSILLLVIGTALLVMGWLITMGTIDIPASGAESLGDFFLPVRSAFSFGFLGAYFFTLNMVFRRYVRADLTPKTYAHITVRLLITIVMVWVISSLPQFTEGSLLESGLYAVAFIIGFIPETGLTLIQDYVRKIANLRSKDKEVLELRDLEGVHLYDRARLLEEGIENIENLAHHNMIELIARTRIPTSRLVDMFDQAVLYLHLGLQEEENKAFFARLKSHGIRTATDLDFALVTPSAYNALQKIEPPMPLDQMEVILQTMLDDDWYQYILQWRDSSRTRKPVITDPYQFYFPSRQTAPPAAPADPLLAPEPAG